MTLAGVSTFLYVRRLRVYPSRGPLRVFFFFFFFLAIKQMRSSRCRILGRRKDAIASCWEQARGCSCFDTSELCVSPADETALILSKVSPVPYFSNLARRCSVVGTHKPLETNLKSFPPPGQSSRVASGTH